MGEKTSKVKTFRQRLRFLDFVPLTPAGLLLSVALAAAAYYRGIADFDLVALAAATVLLLIQFLAILAVVVGAVVLRRNLRALKPESFLELVSGREVASGFEVPLWLYLPLLRVDWKVEEFDSHTSVVWRGSRLREHLFCGRRGLAPGVTRRFTVIDTLGLASLSWEKQYPGRVRVLPHPGSLERPDILLSLVSGEDISDPRGDLTGDRVDMRQYQKGDPMKFILWKVYSRSGKVMVRVPERALAAKPRACCYLLCGQGDEPSAALARVLLSMNMLGEEWRFGADGRERFAVEIEDAMDLLALSGNVEQASCRGLASFLPEAERAGYGFCLVLAPPGDKRLASEVFALLDRSGMSGQVWVGVDVPEKEQTPLFRPLQALVDEGASPRLIHDWWNGRATLVERHSGRVLARTQGGFR